jgi:23S rRNA pseudouridine1911/1915/1917 synthase
MAVCYGTPSGAEGLIDAPIDRHPRQRQQMAVVPATGRPAQTRWAVRETLCGTSLVECRPITGRTHQIRVHMAHLGHALVGDPLYAGRQWRQIADRQAQSLCRRFPRQALHAWRLHFDHPASGEPMGFEIPPHPDMAELVNGLRGRRDAQSPIEG